MTIQFNRIEKTARYLDPRYDFQEANVTIEIRRDPLTGRSSRIAHYVGFQVVPPDISQLIETSKANCPFCPERVLKMTPQFPSDMVEEGRIQKNGTVIFPNLSPYDKYSAVAVISKEHYLSLSDFSADIFTNAITACQDYFKMVKKWDNPPYYLINWNYMPAAGSSQVHPHLQVYATETPGNALEDKLKCSQNYYQDNKQSYWEDLVKKESELGERFMGQGNHTVWLTDFVSQSPLSDIIAIFPEKQTLMDLSQEDLQEFSQGLVQVLQYLGSQGVYSLCMGWFPGIEGQKDFWGHFVISPRIYLAPKVWCTDTPTWQHLYNEHFMAWSPESLAQSINGNLKKIVSSS